MAFQKGQSGNPSGRPKIVLKNGKSLTELAREHTLTAVKALVKIIADDGAPHAAVASAATALLDRGWGRPAQSVTIAGDQDNPLMVRGLDKLSTGTLREIASLSLSAVTADADD